MQLNNVPLVKFIRRMRWTSLITGFFILTVFIVLPFFGVNFSALATFGGLIIAGFSFAARNLIGDWIGAIILTYDGIFEIGDRIKIENIGVESFQVTEIGWRDVLGKNSSGQSVSIPNHIIAHNIVILITDDEKKKNEKNEKNEKKKNEKNNIIEHSDIAGPDIAG